MYDQLEIIGDSIIQHGKYNDRIYILDLNPKDIPIIFHKVKQLVEKNSYSKIVAKVPEKYKAKFIEKGFTEEAHVPNFYYGKENMSFLANYPKKSRKIDKQKAKAEKVLKVALKKTKEKDIIINKQFTYEKLSELHSKQMTNLYKKVFDTYPFPIFDENYIKQTMEENVEYFGVFKNRKLIGIASCEVNDHKSYVEMTDFAISEIHRGKQISLYLLKIMEEEMRKRGIKKAYTMARALSFGMNIAFSKMGYEFTGTVINNANIYGDIESLNIWHKDL